MTKFNERSERLKLRRIVKSLPDDKRKLCEGLIADASFMVEQLAALRDHIAEYGWSEEYQNGENQRGKKTSVEADAYLKLQKSYVVTIRQLSSYIPEDKAAAKNQNLLDWVNER